jgi:hypothetical protein
MSTDGDFVIAWDSDGQDGALEGIYARRYDSQGGERDSSEFRVNTVTAGDQYISSIAMDADGDFVITWQSYFQDGYGDGVYARRYDSQGGVSDISEFRVNTVTEADQLSPSIAIDTDGDFVVTWHSYGQDGSNTGIYAQRFTALGQRQ